VLNARGGFRLLLLAALAPLTAGLSGCDPSGGTTLSTSGSESTLRNYAVRIEMICQQRNLRPTPVEGGADLSRPAKAYRELVTAVAGVPRPMEDRDRSDRMVARLQSASAKFDQAAELQAHLTSLPQATQILRLTQLAGSDQLEAKQIASQLGIEGCTF
jgi:hypothetical protein